MAAGAEVADRGAGGTGGWQVGRRPGLPVSARGLPPGGQLPAGYFDRAAKSIVQSGFYPHELRHTAASLAIASGATVKSVQRMLGHASATLTLDRYGHLFADGLDDVAARLDDAMRENAAVPMWSRTNPTLFDAEGQEA